MGFPGRNDPCPCGSGKKYKKCCLAKDEAARPRTPDPVEPAEEPWIAELRPELDDQVDDVLARLQAGAGSAVEGEIKALLRDNPHHHTTNFAMGVYLAVALKDYAGSIPYFERAVKIFPPFAVGHFNLGNSARWMADIPKAVAAYRAAARYSQGDDGIAELARKEIQFIEQAVLKSEPFPSLDAYLANARLFNEAFERLSQQDYESAVRLFNQVLAGHPKHVQSFGNLGLALAGLGRRADALESFDRALALDPNYEPARINRRVIETMREGEPFKPDGVKELHYYLDKLKEGK
jgi:tetratricopeptide (TPR) repeat protein